VTDTTKTVAEADPSGLRVPRALQHDAGQILAFTTPFCAEHLDEEYGQLCRSLVGMLARKRPSPLARGDLRVWAAAVIYAVGANNFLFDRESKPFLSGGDLAALTGVAKIPLVLAWLRPTAAQVVATRSLTGQTVADCRTSGLRTPE
jgi:hypothetical protein